MSNTLVSAAPPPASRRGLYAKRITATVALLLGIGGSVWLYQNSEADLDTYKSLIVQAGPWCGGGRLVRTALQTDNTITRAEAQKLRLDLDTLKERGQKCIDPAPEPIIKPKKRA